jgi:hypothetical protein
VYKQWLEVTKSKALDCTNKSRRHTTPCKAARCADWPEFQMCSAHWQHWDAIEIKQLFCPEMWNEFSNLQSVRGFTFEWLKMTMIYVLIKISVRRICMLIKAVSRSITDSVKFCNPRPSFGSPLSWSAETFSHCNFVKDYVKCRFWIS